LTGSIPQDTIFEVRETAEFRDWLDNLRDRRAQRRIDARLRRLRRGNFGDVKVVGGSVSELRIDYGPGYRVYFTRKGNTLVLLLAGGDKKSQQKDIALARLLAETPWENAHERDG